MKTYLYRHMVLLVLTLLLFIPSPAVAEIEAESFGKEIKRVEIYVYGSEQPGPVMQRLSKVEEALFGRSLPGVLADRKRQLVTFVLEGTDTQPSMIFKTAVVEWSVAQKIFPNKPVSERISDLENLIEGQAQSDKPLAMRLERIVGLVLPENISWRQMVALPQGSLVKFTLLTPLSTKGSKVGDEVRIEVAEDLVVDGSLLIPRGALGRGTVIDVKPPRPFGVAAVLKVNFEDVFSINNDPVKIIIGEKALDKTKQDTSMAAAAGASFLGLAVLGPIGLVGGLFIRGDAISIPSGSRFYLQTVNDEKINGYPIPTGFTPPTSDTTDTTGSDGDLSDDSNPQTLE